MQNSFQEDYARLNEAQRAAVDAIEGPVLVVAGPGTGKTQILTLRIANIIRQTDTAPEQILALTFTESGQKAMRERLRRYLGKDAYRVPIFTFHAFAAAVIGEFRESFPQIAAGRLAGDIDKISIVTDILASDSYRSLAPLGKPDLFVKDIVSIIGNLKQEYVTPDRFAEVVNGQADELAATEQFHTKGAHKGKVRGEYKEREKQLKKNQELLSVYRAYEALLRERQLFDFDDMLLSVVEALTTDENLRLELQERYQYVLADEHQDVNGTQNELLERLMSYHDYPNIFAVGDEKQAIYRFQGASLENFLRFEETFAGTKRIELRENYRSAQGILDAAQDLVEVDDGPLKALRVPLTAANDADATLGTVHFSHEAVEEHFLIEKIKAQAAAGIPYKEQALLVKTNKEVERLARVLRSAGIPVAASADSDILDAPLMQYILQLLRVVLEPTNEVLLAEVMQYPFWGMTQHDVFALLAARSYEVPLSTLLFDETVRAAQRLEHAEAVQHMVSVLHGARDRILTQTPTEVLAYLLETSGLLDHVLQHDPHEGIRVVRRIYDEFELLVSADTNSTLADAVLKLSVLKQYNIALSAPYVRDEHDAVQVMTAHKSKGLEFDTVFIPYLKDSQWGGMVRRKMFKIPLKLHAQSVEEHKYDDEIRLLYVAMTRAKQTLLLSYSEQTQQGREATLSRLLSEIDEMLLPPLPTAVYEETFTPTKALKRSEVSIAASEIFRSRFQKKGFSATSCNNFFESPWLYFYRNLLQVPEVPTLSLRYGTMIHAVLEAAQRSCIETGTWPPFTMLEKEVSRQLKKLPITKETYVTLHQQALEELVVSYEALQQRHVLSETRVEVAMSTVLETGIEELPELPLTGKLDRVEYEDSVALRVVDFKTGKPKSRNEILGDTKASNGNYHRQLVFYALLLNTYEGVERSREGTLFFVQPTAAGEVRQETFMITPEEVAALRAELIAAAQKVVDGSVLDVPVPEDFAYAHVVGYWQE